VDDVQVPATMFAEPEVVLPALTQPTLATVPPPLSRRCRLIVMLEELVCKGAGNSGPVMLRAGGTLS